MQRNLRKLQGNNYVDIIVTEVFRTAIFLTIWKGVSKNPKNILCFENTLLTFEMGYICVEKYDDKLKWLDIMIKTLHSKCVYM